MKRLVALAAAVLGAACTESAAPEPEFPDHAAHFFFLYPNLVYTYVDSTPNANYRLDWAPGLSGDTTFLGYNCVIFVPRTPTDTIGEVHFRVRGNNQGRQQLTNTAGADSVDAFFLALDYPTRGRFVVNTAGSVSLNWDNGTPSRYFAPDATLRIANDTLYSDVTHTFTNGYVTWHVEWLRISECV